MQCMSLQIYLLYFYTFQTILNSLKKYHVTPAGVTCDICHSSAIYMYVTSASDIRDIHGDIYAYIYGPNI